MRSRRNRYPFIQRRSPLGQRLEVTALASLHLDGTASNPQQSGCYPHSVPMKPHEMNFRGPCCVAGGSCFVHPLIKNFVGISIRWVCLRLQEGQTLNRWTCLLAGLVSNRNCELWANKAELHDCCGSCLRCRWSQCALTLPWKGC